MRFLFWDCLEPFYGVVSTFPKVHLDYLNDFFVYAVEDVFAYDANFRFAWINESAGRVVDDNFIIHPLQYHSKVNYHLSSCFLRDESLASRDETLVL